MFVVGIFILKKKSRLILFNPDLKFYVIIFFELLCEQNLFFKIKLFCITYFIELPEVEDKVLV